MKQPFPRLLLSLALIALLTPAADARVVSYAPYTDKISLATFHSRTTRHFLLSELSSHTLEGAQPAELVLYDSAASEEPRVLNASAERVRWAAMWEDERHVPAILIAHADSSVTFSNDGGATFKMLTFRSAASVGFTYTDNGGPFTRGRFAPVRIGNAEYPFVVYDTTGAIWRVSADGTSSRWIDAMPNSSNALLGSNAEGTKFIVRRGVGDFVVAGFDGTVTEIASPSEASSGWIAPDGRVYLESPNSGLWVNDAAVIRYTSGFAIPTSDYAGAWIIEREPGVATRLFRHTLPKGLETMWSDATAPQVEALHAGASGNTLLVQVHRPRQRPDRIAVTDPALAVWRVGEPAPRVYDELFLIEQPNKGFIHVDVDRVAAGEPFVFDSGVSVGLQVYASSTDSGGGGDVLQEFGVVRASLRQQLVLPGVGRTLGAFGSNWTTDVVLYNPEPVPQKVELRFVQTGDAETRTSTADDSRTITLNAKEIRLLPDILGSLFARVDSGALFITPERTLNATGRTYARAGSGSFGFGMTAIDVMAAASPRFPMTFIGALPGPTFRTNVTLIDATGRGAEATLLFTSSIGQAGFQETLRFVPPAGQLQINGFSSPNQSTGLIIRPKRGFLVASVFAIDNITNDPTWFPPDLPAFATRWIPVMGHVSGANGAVFRTDLHLYNPSTESRHVYLVAHPWNPSEGARQVTILMKANESRVIRDAYLNLFGRSGLARLRYYSSNPTSGVRVTSRTYTVDAKGGTYGNLTPPLNGFQLASVGDALEILGAVGGAGQRTNLGLVEMHMWPAVQGEEPGSARVELIDNRGRTFDTFTVSVPISGGLQLNDIFRSRGHGDGPEAALIRVIPLRGQFATYATVTDNVTNDSIYLASYLKSQE